MIKFTKEHFARLSELASAFLFGGEVIYTKLGQPLNIYELVHTTSINQLGEIKNNLSSRISKIEAGDEWIEVDNEKLSKLQEMKEMINLLIGWKHHQIEKNSKEKEKEALTKQLEELKESQKTPEEKIQEIEAKIISL